MSFSKDREHTFPEHRSDSETADLLEIRRLELLANCGLWALALFTAISIGAYRNFSFLPELSEGFRKMLGPSPPVNWINWALTVYGFAALILILARMSNPIKPRGAFAHVGYLTAFYALYFFSETLEENFWAVFVTGMTILGLQGYHIWNHFHSLAAEQKKVMARRKALKDF